jgi:hypothetical protein
VFVFAQILILISGTGLSIFFKCACKLINVSIKVVCDYVYSLEDFVCVCVLAFSLRFFLFGNRFDVDGYVTGFGNPDWARTHPAATLTAPAILAILRGGATCVGKTVTAEMAYRLVLVLRIPIISL